MNERNMLRIENEIKSRMDVTVDLGNTLQKISTNRGVNGSEEFYVNIDKKPIQIVFYKWEYFCKVAMVLKKDIQMELRNTDTYPYKIFFIYRDVEFKAILSEEEYEQFGKLYPIDSDEVEEKEPEPEGMMDEDDT